MNDTELLQAIRQIVKEEVEPVRQDVSGLKEDASGLKEEVSGLKADVTKIKIFLENDIDRKLSALFDGHQLDTERAFTVEEKVEDIESSLLALEVVTRNNIKEINRLKEKIG